MPITKSAVKAMRQNIKRRRRNLHLKIAMKDEIRSLQTAIAEGNKKLVAERLASAQSKVDKAAKANVIHKNKAARTKSQLAQQAKESKPKKAAENAEQNRSAEPVATAKAGQKPAEKKAEKTAKKTEPTEEK